MSTKIGLFDTKKKAIKKWDERPDSGTVTVTLIHGPTPVFVSHMYVICYLV